MHRDLQLFIISSVLGFMLLLPSKNLSTRDLIILTFFSAAFIFMFLRFLVKNLILFKEAIRIFRSTEALDNTPTSKIRSAAQGYVELSGIQGPLDKPLISPLTKSECTWFRYRVFKLHKGSENNTYWKEIKHITSHDFIKLTDETGECILDPKGASIKADYVTIKEGNTPEYQEEVDKDIEKAPFWSEIPSRYRYEEVKMDIGSPLYVIGNFRTLNNSLLIEKYQNNQEQSIVTSEWLANLDTLKKTHLVTKPEKIQKKPYILSIKPEQELINDRLEDALYAIGKALCGLGFFLFFALPMIRSIL